MQIKDTQGCTLQPQSYMLMMILLGVACALSHSMDAFESLAPSYIMSLFSRTAEDDQKHEAADRELKHAATEGSGGFVKLARKVVRRRKWAQDQLNIRNDTVREWKPGDAIPSWEPEDRAGAMLRNNTRLVAAVAGIEARGYAGAVVGMYAFKDPQTALAGCEYALLGAHERFCYVQHERSSLRVAGKTVVACLPCGLDAPGPVCVQHGDAFTEQQLSETDCAKHRCPGNYAQIYAVRTVQTKGGERLDCLFRLNGCKGTRVAMWSLNLSSQNERHKITSKFYHQWSIEDTQDRQLIPLDFAAADGNDFIAWNTKNHTCGKYKIQQGAVEPVVESLCLPVSGVNQVDVIPCSLKPYSALIAMRQHPTKNRVGIVVIDPSAKTFKRLQTLYPPSRPKGQQLEGVGFEEDALGKLSGFVVMYPDRADKYKIAPRLKKKSITAAPAGDASMHNERMVELLKNSE